MNPRFAQIETLALHAGQPHDPQTGAVIPPISLSTTFAQEAPGRHKGFDYSRSDNPTRRMLEQCVAALEGGTHALAFASGCAAAASVMQTLEPGSHVVACDDVYGGTFRLLEHVFRNYGIETTWVDLTSLGSLHDALRPETRLVWTETPTNPLLRVVDIAAVSAVARAHGALLCVDNTFATPVLQRPLALGADVVVHSTTKYLNGHSDSVGGVVVTHDAQLHQRLRFLQKSLGAVPSPFDCFLVLRGLKTLPVRIERHCGNATRLARWLSAQPGVDKVIYPGLADHPQHTLAAEQMKAPGGMLSFVLGGGRTAADRLLGALELLACAESLGGVESLIEHPASMTHAGLPPALRARLGIDEGLVRVSVGLEAESDLREDLRAGLDRAREP
ncbi:MAG: PLP-dependent aspartate aminotransferase family protein [Proteobacteria bacterium]|nr:PLP-dependent aspartate aminotransferase family protein [Pseudomonadota bacterium]